MTYVTYVYLGGLVCRLFSFCLLLFRSCLSFLGNAVMTTHDLRPYYDYDVYPIYFCYDFFLFLIRMT